MKTEKIEKHRARRTVVVAKIDAAPRWDVVGVIRDESMAGAWVYGLSNGVRDHWSHRACNIRKATDGERAAFFMWLVENGNDLADGFARFGGAPRGFEAWRAAQDAPTEDAPEPALPAVGWMFTPPKPAFTVGQRVRLVSGGGLPPLLCFTNGGLYTVRKVAPNGSSVELELESGESGFAAADQIEPAPVEPPAPKHKRGDLRVWLRSNGIGAVARVTGAGHGGVAFAEYKAYPDDAVYEPTRENVAALVAKQRERGVAPELGDLVYVIGERGAIGLVTCAMDKLTVSVPVWGDISRQLCDVLVIRRNPLREVGDA